MAKTLPRKLLLVEADPEPGMPKRYNIMLEIDDRTMTFQVPEAQGSEIMSATYDKVLEIVVQRGLGSRPRFWKK